MIVRGWRSQGERIAFVPTMGNLHEGHLTLIDEAKRRADRVVVSIFVNPLQFDRPDDLAAYPRTLDADRRALEIRGAHLLFTPDETLPYPRGMETATRINVPELGEQLEGAARPGHYTGVATVVCKLLNLVQPDDAIFGEKDYQQLLLVRRMVADLNLPVQVHGVPVARTGNGLALSSRNSRLSDADRERAPHLHEALDTAGHLLTQGAPASVVEAAAGERLHQAGFRVDYVAVRSASDLSEPDTNDTDLVILAAAWLGNVRLIDCVRAKRG
ncbi:pantoate--beta-alanine ligase [Acidihalobacter ferrooxydans]|uniref:Pantothenate synthetase n=2 Tax=Acidihalobacter ferrooxydans TaxID=1765967 RepID=A0A1P8UL01_9GAMM|nr:pantoate--beta-alanine ligase [Acidihalobacter ferrooxydans]APZ44510.1 pantoate--beta-alanine ligase [Acidihalobacter ferrooxydans]